MVRYWDEHLFGVKMARKSKEESYAVAEAYIRTLPGRLNKCRINASGSSKKRNQDFSLTIEDMWTLWNNQNGKCYYTGWELGFETKTPTLMSLDRIDTNKGYSLDNVVMCCWCVNKARSGLSRDYFLEMCAAITKKHGLETP